MMNHDDMTGDHDAERKADERLRSRLITSGPEVVPTGLAAQVRRRVVRRVFQQRAAYLAGLLLVLLGLASVLRPQRTGTSDRSPALDSANLDDELLAELFAPPPVDSLAVLERRQQVALQALGHLQARTERNVP